MYSLFARIIALIGSVIVFVRHKNDQIHVQALGNRPAIPTARPQSIPTLKMPTAKGWTAGQTPAVASGL